MTKVKIIGEQPEAPKKKIEFFKYYTANGLIESRSLPEYFENIELICRGYKAEYDLMFAYNKDRSVGTLYLGHFNDGVV